MSVPVTPQSARTRLHAVNEILRDVKHLPEAVAVLRRSIAEHDGFGSKGETSGRGSSPSSSVESAALATGPLFAELDDIADVLDSLTLSASLLAKFVRRWAAPQPTAGVEPMRCTVGTYHDDWALPRDGDVVPCPDLVEHYPSGNPRPEYLCEKHRTRMRRAEREHERQVAQ